MGVNRLSITKINVSQHKYVITTVVCLILNKEEIYVLIYTIVHKLAIIKNFSSTLIIMPVYKLYCS